MAAQQGQATGPDCYLETKVLYAKPTADWRRVFEKTFQSNDKDLRIKPGESITVSLVAWNYHKNYDPSRHTMEKFVFTSLVEAQGSKPEVIVHLFGSNSIHGTPESPEASRSVVFSGVIPPAGGRFTLSGGMYELDYKANATAIASAKTEFGNGVKFAAGF